MIKIEAASPPLSFLVSAAQGLRGRPSGLKGAARRYATGLRPALDPGASAAPHCAVAWAGAKPLPAQAHGAHNQVPTKQVSTVSGDCHDLHTYAVTAGHCRNTAAGYARDTRSGLTGSFIRAIVDAPRSGGADYGLIDFGTQSMPLPFIGDTPLTDDHPQPRMGQSICHIGASSGQHCGQVAASQGEDQYLTTGMPPSVPGDSGGPVWTQSANGYAHIIGIWLGEKTRAAGQEYGRFGSLASGLQMLNES